MATKRRRKRRSRKGLCQKKNGKFVSCGSKAAVRRVRRRRAHHLKGRKGHRRVCHTKKGKFTSCARVRGRGHRKGKRRKHRLEGSVGGS